MPHPPARKGLYGGTDLEVGQEVRVVLRGKVTAFDAHDNCMQIVSDTAQSGYYHYVFDGDPGALIIPVKASIPPKKDDVWRFGSILWHADANGNLYRVNTARGGLTVVRGFETVLSASTKEPDLLFRYHV